MSTMTTSASSLSAMQRATVAPTLPAPPTTVTLRFMLSGSLPAADAAGLRLHALNDFVAELRALQLGGTIHQPREVVGDASRSDRAVHALDHEIGGFVPLHVPQHHLARQDHGTRVHLVQVRV